jgi:hypothetical protein
MRVLTSIAVFLTAAAGLAVQQPAPTLPAAPLHFGAFVATFAADGTFTLDSQGWPPFRGTWTVEGSTLEIVTPGVKADGCDGRGRYGVVPGATGGVTFHLIDDECRPRRMILDGSTWRLTADAAPMPERRITRTAAPDRPPLPPAPSDSHAWPSFRGPNAAGATTGMNLPERWDGERGENVLWRTPVPGLAHSSPIVWGNRVFVTSAVSTDPNATFKPGLYGDGDASADRSPHRWMVFAFDARTGARVWERVAHEGVPLEKRHIKSTYASATPATDGRIVVAWFGSHGVHAYTVDGDPLWRVDLGRIDLGAYDIPTYEWGSASSPIIWNDFVILQVDTQADSFLLALDARTGDVRWKTDRDELPSWGTPSVADDTSDGPAARDQCLELHPCVRSAKRPRAVAAGRKLEDYGTHPALAGDLLLVASGRAPERPIFAVRPSARGDI